MKYILNINKSILKHLKQRFILAKEPRDITDEFERMKAHTKEINDVYKKGLGNS